MTRKQLGQTDLHLSRIGLGPALSGAFTVGPRTIMYPSKRYTRPWTAGSIGSRPALPSAPGLKRSLDGRWRLSRIGRDPSLSAATPAPTVPKQPTPSGAKRSPRNLT